jgi:hypothetical protein
VTDPTRHGDAIFSLDVSALADPPRPLDIPVPEPSATDALAIGNTIFYTTWQGLVRVAAGKPELIRLEPDEQVQWETLAAALDARHLVATGQRTDGLYRACVVTVAIPPVVDCAPILLHSGRVAFKSDSTGFYYNGAGGIRRHDFETPYARDPLVSSMIARGGLAVTPSGKTLVVSTCGPTTTLEDAGAVPPRRIAIEPLVEDPSLAGDGTLAYLTSRDGHVALAVHGAAGGADQVTALDGASPMISPDATRVAFVAGAPASGIRIITLATGATASLSEEVDYDPEWLDATHVVFTRHRGDGERDVFVVSTVGGAPVPLVRGRVLVAAGGGRVLVGRDAVVEWLDPATGTTRRATPLPDQVAGATISPDGRWIAFRAGATGNAVLRARLDDPDGKLETVYRYPVGRTSQGAAIDNAGRVVVTRVSWSGELHAITAAAGTRF